MKNTKGNKTTTVKETAPTAQVNQPTQQTEKKPQVVLFNQFGFETVAKFDEFIASMKNNNYQDVLVCLNTGIRAISQRGGFSLEENEAISVALRQINAAFVSAPQESTNDTTAPSSSTGDKQ